MAVICATAGFWAPCTYKYVGDDLQLIVKKFRVRWKRLHKSERKAMDARLGARMALLRLQSGIPTTLTEDELADLRTKAITEDQFLREMLLDWDLTDAQNKPLAYSLQELDDTAERNDGLDVQIFNSYFDALAAMADPKAVEKNSDAPSGTTT